MERFREHNAPTREEIATYAFHLWDAEGRQLGRDLDYWLEAEAHLFADRCYEAGCMSHFPEHEPHTTSTKREHASPPYPF